MKQADFIVRAGILCSWALSIRLDIAGSASYLRAMCRLWPYVSVGNIPGRLEESLSEHQELIAAIEGRDAARAEEDARRHIAHTREALRRLAAA